VATLGFGVDIYAEGAVATGLDVPRGQRGASVIGGVVLIAMLVVPSIARRLFPALRAPSSGRARRSQPDA
jgi:hypothetical protein